MRFLQLLFLMVLATVQRENHKPREIVAWHREFERDGSYRFPLKLEPQGRQLNFKTEAQVAKYLLDNALHSKS